MLRMALPHPSLEQISLPIVLAALGDTTRLAIVRCLARHEAPAGLTCGQFGGLTSKTNLTYHMAKLREAGVVTVRLEGTRRFISLRRDALDARFPGLLDSIAGSSVHLPPPDAFVDADLGGSSHTDP